MRYLYSVSELQGEYLQNIESSNKSFLYTSLIFAIFYLSTFQRLYFSPATFNKKIMTNVHMTVIIYVIILCNEIQQD